ncbi:hypothetical protein ACFVY1_39205 [Streptomyces sp. NPDC058293]|uniref:hypothetical protein n=1 Tax=unclassified Streptomyces TaxID=2593676 RepID=UPI00224DDE8D|nr:hypothetical protein [Streptomyces sp. NBC_00120]MCX5320080.1 hypothetical protein [Streptomyces sp. NBC_00120]
MPRASLSRSATASAAGSRALRDLIAGEKAKPSFVVSTPEWVLEDQLLVAVDVGGLRCL